MANWKISGTSFWNNGANWVGGVVPSSINATADFTSVGAAFLPLDINLQGGPFAVNELGLVSNSVSNFNLFNGTLILASATFAAINITGSGSGTPRDSVLASTLNLGLTSSAIVTVAASAALSINGLIFKTGALVTSGAGTLRLNGAGNIYSGGTFINAGTLETNAQGALGTGDITFGTPSTGTLRAGVTQAVANNVFINSAASPTISAAAGQTLTLSGNLDYNATAGTTLHFGSAADTGTVVLAINSINLNSAGSLSVDGGTLKNAGDLFGVTDILSSTNIAAGATLDVNGKNLAFKNLAGSGKISSSTAGAATISYTGNASGQFSGTIADGAGTLGLLKDGSGVLVLSGDDTYSGITQIMLGTLALSATGDIASSASVNVAAGSFLTNANTGFHLLKNLSNQGTVALSGAGMRLTDQSSDVTGKIVASSNTDGLDVHLQTGQQALSLAGASFLNWNASDSVSVVANNLGNLITGASVATSFAGGAGNDTFAGGALNDSMDGGAGTDTAIYADAFSAATSHVVYNANHSVFIQTASGGTDTLANVEFARFSDRTILLMPIPVVANDAYATAINTALPVVGAGVLGNDSDPASLPLTAAVATGPAHGTLALNSTGSFVYTPAQGFSGADSFTYTASNTAGNSAAGTVSVNVGTASNFTVTDTTTGVTTNVPGDAYSGPVAGLAFQYIYTGPDNTNVTGNVPNAFIHTGSGFDAIDVSAVGGTNVLDGGTNSNFLVGGKDASGNDTFFVDDRSPPGDIWSTVGNFHAGDSATVFGITQNGFATDFVDGQGAVGFTGVTLHVTAPGVPTASLTLAGYFVADLTNGRLTTSFGTEGGGTPYFFIHANS